MKRRGRVISSRSLLYAVTIVAWSTPASAGWVIDQAVKGSSGGGKQQLLLQANQMKTVILGSDGKPDAAFILDLNADTFTQINYKDQLYTSAKVQEYVETIQGAMKKATSAM